MLKVRVAADQEGRTQHFVGEAIPLRGSTLSWRINHNVGSVNNHEVPAIIAGHLLAVGRKRQPLKAAPLLFHHKPPGAEVTDSPLGMGC
jgi:hypothetical protein